MYKIYEYNDKYIILNKYFYSISDTKTFNKKDLVLDIKSSKYFYEKEGYLFFTDIIDLFYFYLNSNNDLYNNKVIVLIFNNVNYKIFKKNNINDMLNIIYGNNMFLENRNIYIDILLGNLKKIKYLKKNYYFLSTFINNNFTIISNIKLEDGIFYDFESLYFEKKFFLKEIPIFSNLTDGKEYDFESLNKFSNSFIPFDYTIFNKNHIRKEDLLFNVFTKLINSSINNIKIYRKNLLNIYSKNNLTIKKEELFDLMFYGGGSLYGSSNHFSQDIALIKSASEAYERFSFLNFFKLNNSGLFEGNYFDIDIKNNNKFILSQNDKIKYSIENTSGISCSYSLPYNLKSGILELYERDRVMLLWINKLSPIQIDLKTLPIKYSNLLLELGDKYNVDIFLFDISFDKKIPAFMFFAVSKNFKYNKWNFVLGANADIDKEVALDGAFNELNEFINGCMNDFLDFDILNTINRLSDNICFDIKITASLHTAYYSNKNNFESLNFIFKNPKKISFNEITNFNENINFNLNKISMELNCNFSLIDLTPKNVYDIGLYTTMVISDNLIPIWFGIKDNKKIYTYIKGNKDYSNYLEYVFVDVNKYREMSNISLHFFP